ncbi:hypothetical protein IWQ56_003908 [Coemansia nantahalensis]|uniref:Uncharacterized protein n=2 Tax=Coemansia TaxID=4863 RepID=A0ACC1L2Z0_9FUNG|nr:hypothetical protein IWQ57_006135 [Coemansia nantahalensis]KAJ2765926.1 hypothetical protein IWQ56_003908 [Coemansia nantahalensis]KAJ2799801.1 hypothetical protein H4R21_003424 [Coemansia helicoidea]
MRLLVSNPASRRVLVAARAAAAAFPRRLASGQAAAAQGGEVASAPASSAAHGTVLKGLNIYKEGNDPVALKDDEYPAWLWTLLDKAPAGESAERERQRVERSKTIKEANFMKSRK